MGKFLQSIIPAESLDLSLYEASPLTSVGEAYRWLAALIANGSGSFGSVKRETAIIAALKRAALKHDSIPFQVTQYETVRNENGSVKKKKNGNGKLVPVRVITSKPTKNETLGAVFAREHDAKRLSVFIERLDGTEAVPAASRELVKVTVL